MNDANALHPFTSSWDARGPKRGRRGAVIAISAILAAHAGLIVYLFESRFEPHYAQPEALPPVTATIVKPDVRPPPPPPPLPSHPTTAPPAHPRLTPPPLTEFKPPETIQLPSADTIREADPPPSPPRSETAQPRVLTNPQFDRKPNADDLAQYYPERAMRLNREGTATIRCAVSAKGALVGCGVVSEDPANLGFGDAALKLAKIFKLKPATADGTPVDGGVFSTKITFKLPD